VITKKLKYSIGAGILFIAALTGIKYCENGTSLERKPMNNTFINNQVELSPVNLSNIQETTDISEWSMIEDENISKFLSGNYESFFSIPTKAFKIITLSNISEGLVNIAEQFPERKEQVSKELEDVINLAQNLEISPYEAPLNEIEDLDLHGLYLSHLNVILGNYHQVAENNKYFTTNKTISDHLTDGLLKDEQKHFRSFYNVNRKWPADQAALLYSLYLFDQNFGTNISERPIKEWFDYMDNHGTDGNTGLYYSEVTNGSKFAKIPRGCAMSWSIIYISEFAPEKAEELWTNYKEHFLKDFGVFAGFREVPKGMEYLPDSDSGPIILEVGSSATAFGIGAAKAMNDHRTSRKLNRGLNMGYLFADMLGNEYTKRISESLMASSVKFCVETI
tara:strand:+ start:4297 stop:5472 length:1176 start_codon:yes stop_codon:yes gene_type:complete